MRILRGSLLAPPVRPGTRLGSPFPLAVGFLLAAFAGLRMLYAGSVEPDEADLIIFGQQLAWGYSEQPPLYSWLCAAAFNVFGLGVPAITAIRTFVLALTIAFLVATARLAIPDRRLALLAAASVLMVPSLAWHALTYLTHSILVFLAGIACLYYTLKVLRDGRTRDYALLGTACAAGLLAKYNFALLAGALVLAAASLPEGRRRLLSWKMGLTVVVCLAFIAPHAIWVLDHWTILRDELLRKVTHSREAEIGRLARSLIGLREVATNTLLAAGPITLAVAWTFRRARMRVETKDPESFPAVARLLMGRFLLVAFGMMVAMVLLNGWDRFHERWLMPFMLVLPLWLFATLNADTLDGRTIRRFGWLLAVLALAYLTVRTVQVTLFLDRTGGLYPLRLDFTDLANAIVSEAGERPLILVKQREVGGNLKLAIPGARVLSCYGNLHELPPTVGPIVIAWNPVISGGKPEVPWSWIERFWSIAPPQPIPPEAVQAIAVAKSGPNGRPATVMFAVVK
jgi:4-amino-4-deoxy-L-arabinose transferase-like glycosyltransferase